MNNISARRTVGESQAEEQERLRSEKGEKERNQEVLSW